jgi:tripartite ATP-independent transporter DctP family solute receptor
MKLLLLLALASTPAIAQEKKDRIVIKLGTVAPDGTPWSELMQRIRKRFKKDTGGKIKLKLYLGGRLGGEKEMVRETREGRLHMFGGSTAAVATVVPELNVLEAPFLFASDKEADFVLDKYAKPHVEKLLAEKGFVFFQFAENGWHGLALKQTCVKTLADMKGKKIRSQESTIHLDAFKALGANPSEIPVPEVLTSLQSGVVDGFSNTPLFAFATSWYQGIAHYTVTDHIYQPAVVVYSKKWLDGQPDDVKKVLLAGGQEDAEFGRSGVRAIKQGLIDNFTKSKIEVCPASPELRTEMVKATKNIFPSYCKKASKNGKALCAAIEQGKAEFAKQK